MIPYNHQKIQLWTNPDKSDYAIFLKKDNSKWKNKEDDEYKNTDDSSELLVATNYGRRIKYTKLLDESDYLEDLEYDWKYTLQQWIDNNNNNNTLKTTIESSSSSTILLSDDGHLAEQQIVHYNNNNNNNANNNIKGYQQEQEVHYREDNKPAWNKFVRHRNFGLYRIKKNNKINLKKCRFCKLLYLTNKQRAEHEQSWHANNNKKPHYQNC